MARETKLALQQSNYPILRQRNELRLQYKIAVILFTSVSGPIVYIL